jgi:hypothetical protein
LSAKQPGDRIPQSIRCGALIFETSIEAISMTQNRNEPAKAGGEVLPDEETVRNTLRRLIRHPVYFLLCRWNWKSAVLSCLIRGSLFFAANLSSGFQAAIWAMVLEISFLAVTAEFYGALVQAFRRAKPVWAATLTVMLLLPVINHLMEFFVHSTGGTKRLSLSMMASISLSAFSACFNLFTMRRGVLIVGNHKQSFWQDLTQLPLIVLAFLLCIPKTIRRVFS